MADSGGSRLWTVFSLVSALAAAAVASGTLVALARMLAQRRAAHYYRRSAGHLPPQLQKD